MIEIDWTRCKTPPRQHQKDGVLFLLLHKNPLDIKGALIGDQVGAGKSKQVVDTAQLLFEAKEIDLVLVLTPAFARGVWANPDPALGEVAKHSWDSVPYAAREYSVVNDDLVNTARGLFTNRNMEILKQVPFLRWMVSNYEFIRRDDRLFPLMKYLVRRKFWLVCDESWALSNQNSEQWKASYAIRKMAKWITLLNGTPVADTPMDLNAQMKLIDPRILGFEYRDKKGRLKISCADSRFRDYYAQLKPNMTFPVISGWPKLEELRAKVAPYVIRRETRDCFDLPPILDPVMIEARLKDHPTWKMYTQMRDDMVAWLQDGDASVAKQAIVKGLRLAQITSGFIGGVAKFDPDTVPGEYEPGLNFEDQVLTFPEDPEEETVTKEIGREKLDALIEWLSRLSPQPDRLLIWCRFRPEIERTAAAFDGSKPWLDRKAFMLYGQQSKADRAAAIAALNPDIPVDEPVVVVGQPAAGGAGLNLSGASIAINMSEDFSLRIYLQKRGRIDRPGQRNPIRYVDVVATGPKGQRTINHHVLAALRSKEDIAKWTQATWCKKLMEE
jgi:SNF2 family DNA or RNA helicase